MHQTIPIPYTELYAIGQERSYEPKTCFIQAGEIPAKFGVVLQGLFCYTYLTAQGKEFTKAFMPESSFISAYSAMITGTPSYFTIQALEPSNILEIPYSDWLQLKSQDAKWDKLLISLLEKGYSIKEKRERELLLLDAEGRYKQFLQEYPGLEKRLKQHMVASYLGITPIALSRIRSKKQRINLG